MTRATGESVELLGRDEALTALIGPRLDRAHGLAWHLLGRAADVDAEAIARGSRNPGAWQ